MEHHGHDHNPGEPEFGEHADDAPHNPGEPQFGDEHEPTEPEAQDEPTEPEAQDEPDGR